MKCYYTSTDAHEYGILSTSLLFVSCLERDYERQCQYTPYTSFINVVGLPAITVPTVWTQPESGDYPGKVPMGVQLVGAASSEAWLLSLAAQLNPPTDPRAA